MQPHKSIKPLATLLLTLALPFAALGGQWQSSEWNAGVKVTNKAGGFVVDIPKAPGHLNIVRRDQASVPLKGTITVSYRCTVSSGKPKLVSLDPAPIPPGLRPNTRPALFNDWYDTNGRQWPAGAQCMFIEPDGVIRSYSIKLTPALWTNVYGKTDPAGFKKTAANLKEFWFAFGGANSFTHGLQCKGGTIRIQVLTVTITPK